jgi:Zn finger protein HypA/HybF involved in hydrogenase expression
MAKLIGDEILEERMAVQFECGDCKETFLYGRGFPKYCPECGEEFE